MMTEYTFYLIECNGKRYVGQTKYFIKRKLEHKYNCYNDKRRHYILPLYQYIRANGGWNSCQISVIEICNLETKRDVSMREEYWRVEKDATLNSYLKNRETELVRMKEYREKNRQIYNQKQNQKYKQTQLKKQMLLELLRTAA